MIRLLLLFAYAFTISIIGVAAIKVTVVYMANFYYGGTHLWGWRDAKDVLINGSLLASVFCVFAVAQYLRTRDQQ
jgi:hypothetical protein